MRIRAKVTVKNYELEERRRKLGYTQKDFAEILAMNINRYQGLENLKLKPNEEEAKLISLELDCEIKVLFPQGYERIVNVFKNTISKTVDYIPPFLDSGDQEQLLLEQSNAKLTVEKLFNQTALSPKEKKVLDLRFGLNGEKEFTLEETAKYFGVTRERIRQVEAKGLDKIRQVAATKMNDCDVDGIKF